MKLKELLFDYNGEYENEEVKGLTSNSREVKKGFVFVCINGPLTDGHQFAFDAVKKGALVVICERDLGLKNQIIVENTKTYFADLCAKWFNYPAKKLKLIGVTGTNGKTSVTYMLKNVLETAGNKVGLIGTIQNMIGDEIRNTSNTTPGVFELNKLFSEMADKGCQYCVMEVSSHALEQFRVYNLPFEIAIFTNLTQDHLDYHKTMENYLAAKKKLFCMCKTAVVNSDDEYANALTEGLGCKIVTYSASDNSDYSAKAITYKPTRVEYELVKNNEINHIAVNMGGKFTVYNSQAVAVCALELGIGIEDIKKGLVKINGVKGRIESVPTNKNFTVIIDYAHTPDGLKNILRTFKECEKNRLIVLFGCGGDRDKSKRAVMGDIAVSNADYVIVTSDNPRSEDPSAIIEDILKGTQKSNVPVKAIENRIEAINYAVNIATDNDIIVLAGKGHEDYQILKDGKIHLDEREIVAEALKNLSEGK